MLPCLVLSAFPALAGDEPAAWHAQAGLSALYDNNVLRYSDKYLGRFENREDEGRFHINSADDILFHTSLHLDRSLNAFGDLVSVLGGDLHVWNFSNNSIKNWWSFALSARQELPERITFSLAYSRIPSFYVRHYADDDWVARVGRVPARFQPFSFTKEEYRFAIQEQVLAARLAGNSLIYHRPFRNPHHTTSGIAMVGGGVRPMPGEVSLSHNGVLFLDELMEFPNSTLQALREPMEDRQITVSRALGCNKR